MRAMRVKTRIRLRKLEKDIFGVIAGREPKLDQAFLAARPVCGIARQRPHDVESIDGPISERQ